MESTLFRSRNLTTELNELANDEPRLRQRILELLQSGDPETIIAFEETQNDPKLNLLITDIISSCELELSLRASRHNGTTTQGMQNLFAVAAKSRLPDDRT